MIAARSCLSRSVAGLLLQSMSIAASSADRAMPMASASAASADSFGLSSTLSAIDPEQLAYQFSHFFVLSRASHGHRMKLLHPKHHDLPILWIDRSRSPSVTRYHDMLVLAPLDVEPHLPFKFYI
jgi:hypothetical protein